MRSLKFNQVFLLILCCFSISGCLQTAFTGAASTTLMFAKDRTAGETIDDIKIATGIKTGLIKRNFRDLYTKINVEVVQGRVLLTGVIVNEEDVIAVIDIAWKQNGVKEVINELKVDQKSKRFDLIQYTKDSFITTKIKSRSILNKQIKFINYTIVTIDNTVYLFGMARSKEELKLIAEMASSTNGVKEVISHVRINDMPMQRNNHGHSHGNDHNHRNNHHSNDEYIEPELIDTDLDLNEGL